MRDPLGRKKREWWLFGLCLTAALYGLALIYSATRYQEELHGLVGKQAAALGLGVALCLILSSMDLRALLDKLWWALLLGNVVLLLLLIPLGNDDGTGNKSWISLPGGSFNFQPAEIVKVSFVLLLALHLRYLSRRGLNRPWSILQLGVHVLALCGLLYGVWKGWEPQKWVQFGWATDALAASSLNDYAEPADEKQVWDVYAGNARVQR